MVHAWTNPQAAAVMSGLTDDISPRLPEGPRCEPVLQTFASVDESPRAHEYSPPLTVPVATIVGTIRLSDHKTGKVTEVLYDETQIFLWQFGYSNFRVDDRQVVLLVEAGKVWLYPGQHQTVGVRKGPKQPTIVVKDWCQLLDQYEFTLGVTESPFEGDTESHVAFKWRFGDPERELVLVQKLSLIHI